MSDYQTILNSIPKDWEVKSISELGVVVGGGTPTRDISTYWNGNIPWITPGEVSKINNKFVINSVDKITEQGLYASGANLLPERSLLVTSRATLGARAICSKPMATNQGFKSIIFNNKSDAGFYYHFFGLLKPEMARRASGTTFLEISSKEFSSIPLPYPPDNERTKISHILDTVDTEIQQTELLIEKLQLVKEGLLNDLLTRGIGVDGQLRPSFKKAPELYKKTTIGFIPKEWEVAPLLSKISFPVGQVDPRESPYQDLILVAPDHIDKKTGRLLSKVTAKAQNAISGKYLFQPGDVIYSKIRPYLRKAVCVDFHGLCSADAYPLRPNNDVSPTFLLATILGQQFSTFAESVSMRSGFPKINRSEMSEFKAGWPTLAEQEKISCMIVNANDRILNEEKTLDSLRGIKSGLTHDLLTGRVRVTELLNNKPEVQ